MAAGALMALGAVAGEIDLLTLDRLRAALAAGFDQLRDDEIARGEIIDHVRCDARTVRDQMRSALAGAMKFRDGVAVAALRSALAAIDNAEAVDAAQARHRIPGHHRLAGTVRGLRATEVPQRHLSATQVDDIVRAEAADRHAAACDYERAGQPAHAERLRSEAAVLSACLNARETPAP